MSAKKSIHNVSTSIKINVIGNDGKTVTNKMMDYRDLIITALDNPPQAGFKRHDIARRNKIEDQLKGDVMELDNEDFQFVKQLCNDMSWSVRHKDLQTFLNYLDDVK